MTGKTWEWEGVNDDPGFDDLEWREWREEMKRREERAEGQEMKNEIDKDFYCSAGCYENDRCKVAGVCLSDCDNRHRKYPTPGQFKEEYGEEYPDDAVVYLLEDDGIDGKPYWNICEYGDIYEAAGRYIDEEIIVCACTPWGKPPDDWRPA
jgi:hypothetical protein